MLIGNNKFFSPTYPDNEICEWLNENLLPSNILKFGYNNYHHIVYTKQKQLYILYSDESEVKYKVFENYDEIKQISCGGSWSLILTSDGKLLLNEAQTCKHVNVISNTDNPKLILQDREIKQISTGYDHCLFLKTNGEVYGFGSNTSGQLDLNRNKTIKLFENPTLIIQDKDITDRSLDVSAHKNIYCGQDFTIIQKNANEIICFGSNNCGQLGVFHSNIPIILKFNNPIKSISCGDNHTLVLTDKYELYGFGCNAYGQLNQGESPCYHKDHYNELSTCCCDHDNDLHEPTLLMIDNTIKYIKCFRDASYIYKENGELWHFGENNFNLTLIYNELPLRFIEDQYIHLDWTPNNHTRYPRSFKNNIKLFLLCLKQFYIETQVKIPKFVLFEIIKFICE